MSAFRAYMDEEPGPLASDATSPASDLPSSDRSFDGRILDRASAVEEFQCEIEHTATPHPDDGWPRTRTIMFREPTPAALYEAVADFEQRVASEERRVDHAFRYGDVRRVLVLDEGYFDPTRLEASSSRVRHLAEEAERKRVEDEKAAVAKAAAEAAKEERDRRQYEALHARYGAEPKGAST